MVYAYYVCIFIFLFLSLILSVVILMQESKSMGLGSSFGVDSGDSLFGVSTPSVLKKFTAWLSCIFCFGCMFLSFWTASIVRHKNTNTHGIEDTSIEVATEDIQ